MEEIILRILEDVNEDILSYDGNNMMGDGIIDSFEMIEIVANIEAALDIRIDAQYVVAANFANKNAIINMVKEVIQ